MRISKIGGSLSINDSSSSKKPAKFMKITQQKNGEAELASSLTKSEKASQKAAAAVLPMRVKPEIVKIF